MRTYIFLFVTAALASAVLTPAVIALCRRFGLFDRPGAARKIHDRPVPRLGGVAVVAAFLAALAALFFYDNVVTRIFTDMVPKIGRILLPALVVFALGLADDLRGVRARTKFGVQTAAAVLLWALGFRIGMVSLPFAGGVDLGPVLGALVTVLWVVAVTNAFNFIDGMDGLAAGIALFVSLSVMITAAVMGNKEALILAVPLAGAAAGFLPFNWHPAKVFLGDAGSYFLGFVLAALAVMSSTKSSILVAVAVPVAMLGIPLLDTTLTVARRFLSGQPLFDADGDHIHHRLLKAGLSQRMAVLLLYGLTVVMGALALLGILTGHQPAAVVIPVGLGVLAILVVRRLGWDEFAEAWAMFRKALRFQRQVIGNQVRLRRFVQDIQTAPDAAALFRRLEEFLAEAGFSACSVELWPSPPDSPQSHKGHKDEPESANLESANLLICQSANPDASTINHQPSTYKWSWGSDSATESESWRIRIPLRDSAGAHRGWVTLSRRLEGERVLFQVASLLDAFGVHFPSRLSALDPAFLLSDQLQSINPSKQ
ncbi:MAG TPA: MraY family glycosyltransferase [Acidobacteriota bacterium]|nr:MraY family glycosyltransferase [Acidobacteriota bacterium]